MALILATIVLLTVCGLCALCLGRFPRMANYTGAFGAVSAGILGLAALINHFFGIGASAFVLPWSVPYGSFSVAIDSISALFLLAIFILCALSALYGTEYLVPYFGKKNIGSSWLSFNILFASMILVVTARNAVLFLAAWEIMSISSFFLVMFESEKKEVRKAGLIYIIAAHIGTLFLIVMFILLGKNAGSFDFEKIGSAGSIAAPSLIFVLAVIGFGTKAGFMPMHIWLPEAHPAAPSHVSAVMSGVMIKTGIYGLVRVITLLGAPFAWWGWLLIIIGVTSGILGVLFALAQHDIKRLLAYHSIENIGIIAIGLGLGVLGISTQNPLLATFGFAGALLHVINHALFKGLLFLGAGACLHETGTKEIDVLGGLIKKMPVTAFCFLIGSAAICGLPPLNGFISEFLIYFASFGNIYGFASQAFASFLAIASLALIGGLAVACFTKVFGVVFLGEARSEHSQKAHEVGNFMRFAMITLAVSCIIVGLAGPFILIMFGKTLAALTQMPLLVIKLELAKGVAPLKYIVIISLCFYTILFLLARIRIRLLKYRSVEHATTWDCGYAYPGARMQYTASSFAQPLTDFFKAVLRPERQHPKLGGYFPKEASFRTETPDMFQGTVYRSLFNFVHRMASIFTWFQHGRLQLYILYILIALLALLIWKL